MAKIVTLTPNPALDIATHVDQLVPSHKLRCSSVRRDPGGGGINVARVVHRLGGDALAVYASGGSVGHELHDLLSLEGLPQRPVRVRGQTRESFNVTEDKSGQQYRFILAGAPMDDADWNACVSDSLSAIGPGDFFVCSGSLPPGLPTDSYASAIQEAKAKGARTVIDTQGVWLRPVLDRHVDIVKASARELSDYLGSTPQNERAWCVAMTRIIQVGRVETAVVTLGELGAILVNQSGAWRATVPPVQSSTTVGAGDSFLGGLLVKLAEARPSEVAVCYAAAAGTAALLSAGTRLCNRVDVERLNAKIVVTKLSY